MPWVLIGVVIGALWVALSRSVAWAATPLDALLDALADAGYEAARATFEALGGSGRGDAADVVAVVAAALAPGLVCLLVAEAVSATTALRNAAATLLTFGALVSFFWLPGAEALTLLVLALVLDALLAVGTGFLLTFPVTVVVTALTGRLIVDVLTGAERFHSGSVELAKVYGTAGLWQAALACVAVCAAVGALRMLTRSH